MKKATRYLLALAICIGIFAIWIVFQMYVAKGTLVGVLFCGAMIGAWKAIMNGSEKDKDSQENNNTTENKAVNSSENDVEKQ